MKTTSKYSRKLYQCVHCDYIHRVGTNHYGEVYSRCPSWACDSRKPMINATYQPPRHKCLEKLPSDMTRPEPWKMVRLGDLVEVNKLSPPSKVD